MALGSDSAEAARKKRSVRHAQPDRFASIVVEASTGYVLSERNADKRLYPASLTKMMTLYLTFEALERGALTKNQRVYVSKRASAQEPSSLGLRPGEAIRVEDAILAIATKSANDCAVVLAEAVGGSESGFARAMTVKARRLGMNNTNFVNASGLFNRAQVSSARDMAILSQALIRDHPKYYRYFSTNIFTYEGYSYMNHNKLMSSYEGMDGLKTGYVYASGYNLAASAVRNGTRLIGVVFGGQTARIRNKSMERLLDQSFARLGNIRVASLSRGKTKSPLPLRRPASFMSASEEEISTPSGTAVVASASPFGNITESPVVDQGDTDINDAGQLMNERKTENFSQDAYPLPSGDDGKKNGWIIQIGTFSSHDASLKALKSAKSTFPSVTGGADIIAPLMTNRGMIYRARLSGLLRKDAVAACRALKGNCLILASE